MAQIFETIMLVCFGLSVQYYKVSAGKDCQGQECDV